MVLLIEENTGKIGLQLAIIKVSIHSYIKFIDNASSKSI